MARATRHFQASSLKASDLPDLALKLQTRPGRQTSELFIAEGRRNFYSALTCGWQIEGLITCSSLWKTSPKNLPKCPLAEVREGEFRSLSRLAEPDGIMPIVRQQWSRLIVQETHPHDTWVALDEVRYPGNLGTIIRTCAAAGVRGLMLIGGEADPYDPISVRASMGAIFKLPLIRTSAKALAGWKSRRDVEFVGTSPHMEGSGKRRHNCGRVLMMGSERQGLRQKQIELCDRMIQIPMRRNVDSLNLAVATGIVLFCLRE